MLALSLLVVSVDNTILNVALPTIQEDLDASSSELQWIVDSYLLVFAVLLLVAGSLGDRFGRKRALFTGLSDLRARLDHGRDRRELNRADHLAGGDGPRRRGDHADDALDHHQHLPEEGASEGNRDLGRGGGDGNRDRTGLRWLSDRALRLERRVPGQPADRRVRPDRRRGC